MLPQIAYLVPNLADPAVKRRYDMLAAGGAEVRVSSFVRAEGAIPEAWNAEILGQTRDAALLQRVASVIAALMDISGLKRRVTGRSAVVARNLEMLILARAGLALARDQATPLTYEVLDIHRMMLGKGLAACILRGLEGWLMRRVGQVVVSSPAFDTAYFRKFHPKGPPRRLVENKLFSASGSPSRALPLPPAPPWRIGWFGMLRCKRSLDVLTRLVRENPGRIEVDIRGIASRAVFGDTFETRIAQQPGLHFHGPYSAGDLAKSYQQVHLVWAIDFFEEGLNSTWLLPNRLYEGSASGRPLIALRDVETGRWLARFNAGMLIDDVDTDLARFFATLTPETFAALVRPTQAIPARALVADAADCRALVDSLLVPGS